MAFPSERSEETGEASVAMRVIEMYVIDRDASDRDRQPRFLLWHLCELRGGLGRRESHPREILGTQRPWGAMLDTVCSRLMCESCYIE